MPSRLIEDCSQGEPKDTSLILPLERKAFFQAVEREG